MAGTWIRVGTVSVTQNSKKVTGSGTNWASTASNKPAKGHTFWGPDGAAYEVDYVESDTVLYLADTYLGATASGQAYRIDNTRDGTVPALSRKVSEFYAYQQGYIDALGLVVAGDGDVTFTAPDGQAVTLPSLSGLLSKSGNLAGLADKPIARGNLGFTAVGSSIATAPDSAAVRSLIAAMTPGDYGVGKMSAMLPAYCAGSFDALRDNGFFKVGGSEAGLPAAGAMGSTVLSVGWDNNAGTQVLFPYTGPAQIRSRTGAYAWSAWRVIHDASSDKIEEGAFTPFILVTETGSMSPAGNVGRYRRSGRFVTCVGTVNISDTSPYPKSLKIVGLPFVGSSEGNLFCPAKIIVYGCEIAGRCVVGSKDILQQHINIQLLPTTGRVRDILASDLSGHSNAKIAFEVTYAL